MAVSDFWIDYLKGMSVVRPWDKLILGGFTWPGILTAFEPVAALEFDVAKMITNPTTANAKGPEYKIRITDKGYKPAQIKATLQLWTPDQWADLKDILPRFSPKTTSRTRDAYGITHPAAALLGIKSVIIDSIGVHQPVRDQTLYVDFGLTQWFEGTPFKLIRPNGGALLTQSVPVVDPGGNIK